MNLEHLPPSYPVVVLMLDRLLHTDEHPHCDDPECPCWDGTRLGEWAKAYPNWQTCPCPACTYVRSVLAGDKDA